jgi:predicted methyltransferase
MAQRVSLATGTPTSVGSVSRVLGCLRKSFSFWSLAEHTDLPFPVLSVILTEFQREKIAAVTEGEWALTDAGLRLADDEGAYPQKDNACPACRGKAVNMVAYRDLVERLESVTRGRPEPLKEMDQGYVTMETASARVALMEARGDLVGRSIFILGDDDLLSIAIGLRGGARRVLVAEADERLIAFIAKASARLNLGIEAVNYNAMDPIPEAWLGKFDVFETDPVEAETGFKLFLQRCILTQEPGAGAGYFGLTRREASLFKWRRLQAFLLDCGFAITEMIHDFNDYVPWEYHGETPAAKLGGFPPAGEVWYKSSQYRLERVADVPLTNERYDGPLEDIYDDAEQTTK